ncbi:MAG: hypothetical protein D6737_05725 [Chloroflexi bacterium]|nr:MAG: hypothetical protein D6737_05725 [Chloroflexota bacterium]
MVAEWNPTQYEERIPRLYPDCGCASPEDCIPCPECGQCMNGVEYCNCDVLPSEVDELFGYDVYVETLGG